jgi:predicted transcriptional regulator
MSYGFCKKIIAIALALNFLMTMPVFAEQQTMLLTNLTENETRQWSELEVNALIDDLTQAAHEAIEQAAGEAAKAAAIAALENQAKALAEIARLQKEKSETRKNNIKNLIITGLSCFVAGTLFGGGIIYFTGR